MTINAISPYKIAIPAKSCYVNGKFLLSKIIVGNNPPLRPQLKRMTVCMAMKFQREAASEFAITGYTADSVSVAGVSFTQSLCVSHQAAAALWPVATFADITASAVATVIALQPEIVIIGTGKKLRFPTPTALAPLREHRMGFEVMDTAAACRTYNVLLGEGRQVAALLLLEAP